MLVAEQICRDRGKKLRIAADLDLFVVDVNRTEVFGEAFVEPSLGRRVVEIQQHHGKVVSDGPPGLLFEQIQDDEVLIFPGQKKSGNADRLHTTRLAGRLEMIKRRELVVGLVILEGEDGQRDRLIEVLLGQQSGENR